MSCSAISFAYRFHSMRQTAPLVPCCAAFWLRDATTIPLHWSRILRRTGKPLPWTWASTRGRAEPPQVVLPAADPATFLDRHGASHGPHLANVAAIAREVCNLTLVGLHARHCLT